jgi:Fe-S-cluster containining protein
MDDMITGGGRMAVDGVPVDVRFTVPRGACAAEAVLPEVMTLANQLTDVAVAKVEAAGQQITCAKGCGACCRQLVPITPVEARHLARVVEELPAERAAEVRARFAAAREKVGAARLAVDPDGDRAAYREYGLAYFRLGVPCPFLEEESCSIHPVRPLVCREYLVTSPPEHCAELGGGGVRQVPVPRRVWAIFGRTVHPTGALDWLPLIDALEYAAEHPDSPADRTGPERVDALLQALQR